jgi:3-methyl-2-oxobutanoate hydroxymethyltransferase
MSVHAPDPARPALNLVRLREMGARGEKIAMLTCYDATFARLLDAAGVDMLLVGDSLGNVVQGQASTLPVTLEHMAYHTACVARGRQRAWLVADMPFGAYEAGPQQAFESAVVLMRAGAQMVKLEGGGAMAHTVRFLVDRGIPVCAHLGLTPQRVHALGGFRVQGRDEAAAAALRADAAAMADAGAALLVLELVPSALAREITLAHPQMLSIGIGAGAGTAGQVLVLHDMLGLTSGKRPRFVRDFIREAADGSPLPAPLTPGLAVEAYVADVRAGRFPDESRHGY